LSKEKGVIRLLSKSLGYYQAHEATETWGLERKKKPGER